MVNNFLAVTVGSTNVAADAQRNDADITLPVSNVRLYTCILTDCTELCREVERFSGVLVELNECRANQIVICEIKKFI